MSDAIPTNRITSDPIKTLTERSKEQMPVPNLLELVETDPEPPKE